MRNQRGYLHVNPWTLLSCSWNFLRATGGTVSNNGVLDIHVAIGESNHGGYGY